MPPPAAPSPPPAAGSAGGGDAALLSVNAGANLILETGAANFNGTTDVWSPNLILSNGDTFRVSAQDSVGLQEISLDVTAIPEPATAMLMGFALLGMMKVCRR